MNVLGDDKARSMSAGEDPTIRDILDANYFSVMGRSKRVWFHGASLLPAYIISLFIRCRVRLAPGLCAQANRPSITHSPITPDIRNIQHFGHCSRVTLVLFRRRALGDQSGAE